MDYISAEAKEALNNIEIFVDDDTLYKGKNTELVALVNGLRKSGYDPNVVRKKWLYCGGLKFYDRPEYKEYWDMFWIKNIGYVRHYPDPKDYGLVSYDLDRDKGNIPSCTCGHAIHYINFICDPTFTTLLLIGSDCALKFCGGYPCHGCGKLQSNVRPFCSNCRCKYSISSSKTQIDIGFYLSKGRCCKERNSVSKYCDYHYILKNGSFDKLKSNLIDTTRIKKNILDSSHTYSMQTINCFYCNNKHHKVGKIRFYNYPCSVCILYKKCMTELFNEYEERRDDLDKYYSISAIVPKRCKECNKLINYKYKYCFDCNKKLKSIES